MRVQFRITGFIAAFVQLTDQVCHCNRTTELFRVNQTKYNQSMNQMHANVLVYLDSRVLLRS